MAGRVAWWAPEGGGPIDHLKAVGVLAVGAVVVMAGVLGLATIVIDDSPTFAQEVAGEEMEGAESGPPTAIGAELEVTGDRPGRFSLTAPDADFRGSAPGDLEGDQGRIIFGESPEGELFIDQMSWEGLEFFLDPADCQIEVGQVNEAEGVARVNISCVDIRDIRDTATVTMEGVGGLPAELVMELDLPEPGGTLTMAGAVTDTLVYDDYVSWQVTPPGVADGTLYSPILSNEGSFIGFTDDDDILALAVVSYGELETLVPRDACDLLVRELARLDPQTSLMELTMDCPALELEGVGTVSLAGTIVLERSEVGLG